MALLKRAVNQADVMGIVSKLKLSDLRASDAAEYSDFASQFYGVGPEKDLPTKMATLLGCMALNMRGVLFTDKKSGEPAFLATVSSMGPGPKTLCGIAWAAADSKVGMLDRMWIMRESVGDLLEDDDAREFRCYVKNTNKETLDGWSVARGLFKRNFDITTTPMTFGGVHGYTEVRISKR